MAKLLETVVIWLLPFLGLVLYGSAPGFFLRLIVRVYPRSDTRRAELVAELQAVPRAERPIWVGEQLEIALFEGLPHRISAILRQLSHRRPTPAQVDDEATRRRKLLATSANVVFGVGVLDEDAAQRPVPSQIGMVDVKSVEAATRAMWALDYHRGGDACRDAVLAQLFWAQRLLSASCQDDVRQRLLRALADLQNLARINRPDDK